MRFGTMFTGLLSILLSGPAMGAADVSAARPSGRTVVDVVGDKFRINGKLTYSELPSCPTSLRGLMFNVRAVNATFDDLDRALPKGFLDDGGNRPQNNFAGYGPWDADANTDRFIAALPSWRARGVQAVTLSFQGGCSCSRNREAGVSLAGDQQTPNNNPFGSQGTPIQPAYLARMKRAIDALDANGMACILGLFYFGQDQRISSDNDSQAIKAAVDAVVDWVLENGWRNVLIEINNEATVGGYQHDILNPHRVHELFRRVKQRSTRADGTRLLVSSSSTGKSLPPEGWLRQADFFLPHGNGLNSADIGRLVEAYRAHPLWKANPRPICFNEDSTSVENFKAAALSEASWGFYNDEHIQSVWPANWEIWSPENIAFFDAVARAVGAGAFIESKGMLVVEAEHFSRSSPDKGAHRSWYTQYEGSESPEPDPDGFHPGAGGDVYMECLPDTRTTHDEPFSPGTFYNASTDGARLDYLVHFQTPGTYYVWVRVNSTGTEDNGLHVALNGVLTDQGQRIQWCGPGWKWSSAQRDSGGNACGVNGTITINVETPGNHLLSFYHREDGVELDRFILTRDKGFDPSNLGIGPPESPCAVPGEGVVRLESSRASAVASLPPREPDGDDRIWIPAATAPGKRLIGAMTVGTQFTSAASSPPDADPEADSLVGQCLFADTDEDDTEDFCVFTVEFPSSGTWYAWGRFYYPGAIGGNDANCLWISVNNGPEHKFGNNRYGKPSYRQWHWDGNGEMEAGVRSLKLGRFGAGKHEVKIRSREADRRNGPRLDVLLLTNDSRYVPSDDGAREALSAGRSHRD